MKKTADISNSLIFAYANCSKKISTHRLIIMFHERKQCFKRLVFNSMRHTHATRMPKLSQSLNETPLGTRHPVELSRWLVHVTIACCRVSNTSPRSKVNMTTPTKKSEAILYKLIHNGGPRVSGALGKNFGYVPSRSRSELFFFLRFGAPFCSMPCVAVLFIRPLIDYCVYMIKRKRQQTWEDRNVSTWHL